MKEVTIQDCIRKAEKGKYAVINNGGVDGFTKEGLLKRLAAWLGRRI